jgi:hypothetical protein
VTSTPFRVLTLTASPASIPTGGSTSSVVASLRINSAGVDAGPDFPAATPVALSTTLGTLNAPNTLVLARTNGTLTSGNTAGTATVKAVVDNQTVTTPVTFTTPTLAGPPPPTPGAPFCANKIKGKNVADKLIGTPARDLIKGKRGDDVIKGRGAEDCLVGGKGNDRFGTRDGVADKVNCGAGKHDVVKADSFDLLKTNCEKVKIKG